MANTFGGKSKVIEKPIAVLNFEGGRLSQIKDAKGYALDTSTLPPLHQEMIRRLRTIKLDGDAECYFYENMEADDLLGIFRGLCPIQELKRAALADILNM